MSLLAAAILALAGVTRTEAVTLSLAPSGPVVRVRCSAAPGLVVVQRAGELARISVTGVELGLPFSADTTYEWTRDDSPASAAHQLAGLRLESGPGIVHLYLTVPPDVPIQAYRQGRFVVVGLSMAPSPTFPAGTWVATSPAPKPIAITPSEPLPGAPPEPAVIAEAPEPVAVAPSEPLPGAPPEPAVVAEAPEPVAVAPSEPEPGKPGTAELYAQLFPPGAGSSRQPELPQAEAGLATARPLSADTLQLYAQLFPEAPVEPEAQESVAGALGAEEPEAKGTFPLGFLRVNPGLHVSYVNMEASFGSTPEPVPEQFLLVQPVLNARGTFWDGRLTADYTPSLRGFGDADVVNTTSHSAGAALELQPGSRVEIGASGRYFSGALETQQADPGGEYFFDLGRFSRQDYSLRASFGVRPRLAVDVSAHFGRVSFKERSGFFDYDSEGAKASLGYELTPNLRALVDYAFDRVPTPPERPEAESQAHNVGVSLTGDITPLLAGRLSAAYRDQQNPNAAEGGRRFRGLTASAELTKVFTRSSSLTLRLDRATPLSAFEQNAFYVTTALQGTFTAPLPASLQLTSGASYRWNDYETPASAIGVPREDRIFGWYVRLRRPLFGSASLSADYRRERRNSNLDEFNVVNEGFSLSLDINAFDPWRR